MTAIWADTDSQTWSGWNWGSSSTRSTGSVGCGRRVERRASSMQTLRAICSSQAPNWYSPLNRGNARSARANTSWVRSSASAAGFWAETKE